MHWMALWCLKQHEKVYSAWYGEHRRACTLRLPQCSLRDGAILNSSYNAFELRWPSTIGRQRPSTGKAED